MKKILALVLSLVLVLGLFAGCGEDILDGITGGNNAANSNSTNKGNFSDSTIGNGGGDEVSSPNVIGMLVLNVNGAVNISYNSAGNVVNMEGANDNGSVLSNEYENYLDKPCSEVICNLIANSKQAGFLTEEVNHIVIKQAKGSTSPAENFLEALKVDAEVALADAGSAAKLVVLSTDNLDEQGWINLESAKALALAYLVTDTFDLFEGSEAPIDGSYGFHVTVGAIDEKLIVDAVTGDVYQGELEDVDYNDEWLDVDATEPSEDTNAEDPEEQPSEPVQDETTEPTEVTEPEIEE